MLTRDEHQRYARHLALPGFGAAAQMRLKNSRVLIVGAGGLGSPAALYLAAAGIGTIGLADDDAVDLSNLQRQIVHGTGTLGVPKVASAAARLADLNPTVTVHTHHLRIDEHAAEALVAEYDIIIDGTDNFATRYILTDATVRHQKPLVYGSIYQFDGQTTVFHPAAGGPCYRCLYPDPPPPHLVPNCALGGVLGVLPGIIGTLQATEALKLAASIGTPLIGRLLLYDALHMRFDEIAIARNPACPLCGNTSTEQQIVSVTPEPTKEETMTVPELTPTQVVARMAEPEPPFLLDVREDYEWEIGRLPGATRIALGELAARLSELDPQRETIVYCRSGARSGRAAEYMQHAGFRQVWNMTGGILRWSDEIDPSIPKY